MTPGFRHSRYGVSPGHPVPLASRSGWPGPWSRRRLLGAGAASALALGAGRRWSGPVAAAVDATPKPIPGGIDPFNLGFLIHVYDFGQEPSTITDFRGTVGIARVAGSGTIIKGTAGLTSGTPVPTGGRLDFDVDMRFMQGLYVGGDGQEHDGTFSLVWLDLYVGPVDPNNPFVSQVHDFNPGIAPNGLLWTIPLLRDAVQADLAAGRASLRAQGLEIGDAGTIPEALGRPEGGPLKPATVSFDVGWSDPTATLQVANAEQGFAGTFLEVTSSIWFTAETADFAFVSDPPDTSKGLFGWLGYETNGAFFPAMGTPEAATPTS